MRGALIAPPSANRTPDAALSWTVGTADADYPVTNAATLEPDIVAKTTGAGAATLRATFGGTERLEGVALINTNLSGLTATLTNNGGMVAQPRVVPSPEDGLSVNVYWDLREVASITATQWNVAVTGAATPIAIGTLLLIDEWTQLRVRWGWDLGDVFPRIEHRTSYGKRLQYWVPTRTRRYKSTALDAAQRNTLRGIFREAHGSILPWPLVPDFDDDAVLLVQALRDEFESTYRIGYGSFSADTATGLVESRVEVEEVSNGVAL